MNDNFISSKTVARYGIYFALIFVARILDRLISIAWPINIAVFTISVSFTLILLSKNIYSALITGTLFGIASLIAAVIFPSPAFMLPWVSVLPRMIVGLAIFGAYKLMFAILNKAKIWKKRYFSAMIASGIGVMVNTITVMFMVSLNSGDLSGYFAVVQGILLTNFIPEMVIGIICVPLLTISVANGTKMPIAGEKKT